MLAGFNPTFSGPILASLTMLCVDDTSELLSNIPPLLNDFGNLSVSAEELSSSTTIVAEEIDYSKDNTSCDVSVQITYGDQGTTSAVFSCVEKQGKWYLPGIDF